EIVPTEDGFTLMPNPTTGSTQVLFELRKSSSVRLEVIDGLGRTVQRSDLGVRPAGEQRTTLDATALANGSYLVRITTNNGVRTARMVVQ
ncbi:MAG TPA: T9SS type A sorting domain-containing protein, partial [Flavobacteriales bacterium]|nr:T9SS type A sorting domain-containing protein [Flavobacteriales bacterium]